MAKKLCEVSMCVCPYMCMCYYCVSEATICLYFFCSVCVHTPEHVTACCQGARAASQTPGSAWHCVPICYPSAWAVDRDSWFLILVSSNLCKTIVFKSLLFLWVCTSHFTAETFHCALLTLLCPVLFFSCFLSHWYITPKIDLTHWTFYTLCLKLRTRLAVNR